jgi:sarcosine dehydrogenase
MTKISNHSSNIADMIIIGGGAAGCSTAMQLATRGQRVIVLERGMLGSGSTGKAAGLGGQLRSSKEETQLLKQGLDIVKDIERRLGKELFVRTGCLHVASTPFRAQQIRDFVAMGKSIDFEIDLVDLETARRLLPCMKTDDLVECCYCPTDGHFQPAELLAAYVQIAREAGAIFHTEAPVERVLLEGGRVKGVQARGKDFFAPIVVNAAGPWSYQVGTMSESPIPTATIGHYYLVTEPQSDVPIGRTSPAIRDRENRIYSRPEVGGLLVGTYEKEPVEYPMEKFPPDFEMVAMKAARDSINVATLIDSTSQRFPFINERTRMHITHGIMTFTPDGHAIAGPANDIQGLFHCTGFCGRGVFQSMSIGIVMAEMILENKSKFPVEHMRPDRFHGQLDLDDREEIMARCYHRYANHYGEEK